MSAEALEQVPADPVEPAESPPAEPTAEDPPPSPRPRRGARSQRLATVQREAVAPVEFKAVASAGNRELASVIAGLGTQGQYKIKLHREEPREFSDPATGQRVDISGFLRDYFEPIDEAVIQKNHGGGRFRLMFFRQAANGSFVYAQPSQMTINVGGDPRLDDVPRTIRPAANPAPPPPPPSESPTLVAKAFDVLTNQLTETRRAGAEPRSADPLVAMLQQQIAEMRQAHENAMTLVRQELAEARRKPPEDGYKDKLLDRMLDGDSARVLAVRTQLESELNMVRQAARDTEARLRDQADRDRARAEDAHKREIDLIKNSHETTLASVKLSNEVQKTALEAENKRLERAITDLKDEVKELRLKKDKSILEQVQDIQKMKEAMGVEDGESSTADKIIEALPEVLPVVSGWFTPREKKEKEERKDRVVKTPDGQKWLQKKDGTRVPIKKTTEAAQAPAAGTEAASQAPTVDVAQMKQVTDYLTRSFDNNADPSVVAQSHRNHVPEWLMQLLRTNSVDDVFYKMAQLPTGSSLTTQKGRVWLRKVGAALVGG